MVNEQEDVKIEKQLPNNFEPLKIVWKNILLFTYLHMASFYGLYLWLSGHVMWQTVIWTFSYGFLAAFGITAGAHRYWTHQSYKAKTPLRLLLAFAQTVSSQNSIHEWCRDHRLHHKFTETSADPHDARRGFWFAHIGWLVARKDKEVKEKGKLLYMSDLEADPIVMFQKKHYIPLVLLISYILPVLVPCLIWGEKISEAWFMSLFRFSLTLHFTWLVNSAAHLWGNRPYDKSINPAENLFVGILAFGEGWHNYHHVFPWDYKTAELGHYRYNFTAAFIDFFAWLGWAYDLKTVSDNVIRQRVQRTGDGSHERFTQLDSAEPYPKVGSWGWDDISNPPENVAATKVLYSQRSAKENSARTK